MKMVFLQALVADNNSKSPDAVASISIIFGQFSHRKAYKMKSLTPNHRVLWVVEVCECLFWGDWCKIGQANSSTLVQCVDPEQSQITFQGKRPAALKLLGWRQKINQPSIIELLITNVIIEHILSYHFLFRLASASGANISII